MYLVVIAWIYVAFMMAVAEATNTTGTVLGGLITFVLYGMAPVALVVYLMGSPGRRRQTRAREDAARAQAISAHAANSANPAHAPNEAASGQPDTSRHAPGDALAPVRKEP